MGIIMMIETFFFQKEKDVCKNNLRHSTNHFRVFIAMTLTLLFNQKLAFLKNPPLKLLFKKQSFD